MIPSSFRAVAPLLVGALVLGGGLGFGVEQAVSHETSPPASAPAPVRAHMVVPAPAKPAPKPVPLPKIEQPAKPVPLPATKAPAPAEKMPSAQPSAPDKAPAPAPVSHLSNLPKDPALTHYSAPGSGKTVALTFDDGPGPSTQAIIDVLKKYNVPATFFNIGQQEAARAALVQEEAKLGYTLGNHTWDHADLTKLGKDAQALEIEKAQAETYQITGKQPTVFRPPYGSYDGTTQQVAKADGMSLWTWNVDTLDWEHSGHFDHKDVTAIVNLAEQEGIQYQHPVILMHNSAAGNPSTVEALHIIIEYFQSHGYTFVAL